MATMVGHRIDDEKLLQAAVEPAKPLLPLLQHADAMFPLVLMLALLLPWYSMRQASLTESNVHWGLRALECVRAESLDEFVDPGTEQTFASVRWQPPLMTWLTAANMALLPTRGNASLLASAVLGTTGLILASYLLAVHLGGYRLGVLVVLLLGLQPSILRLAQEPTPHALGMMWGCLALWMFLSHTNESSGVVSVKLLLSGISLGLCLLTSGPLVILFYVVIALNAVWQRVMELRRSRSAQGSVSLFTGRRAAFRSLLLLAVTAFAVGGWWELMMGARHGAEFWQAWLGGMSNETTGVVTTAEQIGQSRSLREIHTLLAPTFWLALMGLWHTLRGMIQGGSDSGLRRRAVLVPWGIAAITLWMVAGNTTSFSSETQSALQIFWLLPLILLAGVGLLVMIDRQITFPVALVILLLSIAEGVNLVGQRFLISSISVASISFITLISLGIAGTVVFSIARNNGTRQRILLSTLLIIVLVNTSLWGVAHTLHNTLADQQWNSLGEALERIPEVQRCTLIRINTPEGASATAPPILRFLVECHWPRVEFSEVAEWEAMVSQPQAASTGDAPGHIVIAWGPRGRLKPPPGTLPLRSLGPTHFQNDLEIALFARSSPDARGLSPTRNPEPNETD